ncbi:hypothetical protein PCL_09355 [Purpureocillium lilacinum]|uniref:Uncharacterized protein n=1 Tax=Purpureocillium lilacinum TaxID=33203 RepID=A0A2U3EHT6_PURLI|nr:hypothetical protein Purlil1_714 [Purpureocillium lilacinum]PWI74079.1 hypothetical protein PCL_09355 [Purpureocillium lilacinum]
MYNVDETPQWYSGTVLLPGLAACFRGTPNPGRKAADRHRGPTTKYVCCSTGRLGRSYQPSVRRDGFYLHKGARRTAYDSTSQSVAACSTTCGSLASSSVPSSPWTASMRFSLRRKQASKASKASIMLCRCEPACRATCAQTALPVLSCPVLPRMRAAAATATTSKCLPTNQGARDRAAPTLYHYPSQGSQGVHKAFTHPPLSALVSFAGSAEPERRDAGLPTRRRVTRGSAPRLRPFSGKNYQKRART